MPRRIQDLAPEEVIALAVEVERCNTRRFRAFAASFQGYDGDVARRFEELAGEEEGHEARIVEWYKRRFARPMPAVSEFDVEGVVESIDLADGEHQIFDSLKPEDVYGLALEAEEQASTFYRTAAEATRDKGLRKLFEELAGMEEEHASWLKERAEGRVD